MAKTLAEVFDVVFENVKFDSRLKKEVYRYQIGYVNKNHEYLDFFGSNLLGVHVIRFTDQDVMKFFNIFDVDYYTLTEEIRKVTTINHEFKISGDILNLSLMYIIHRFLTSPLLNDKDRLRGAYDCALVFFYRCVAAICSDWFKYPVDPKIAQATFSRLTNKFLIKKLGSWHKVMDYRANELLGKESIHLKNLIRFNDDGMIVYAINDSQGRIKDLIKNYYAEFSLVHENGEYVAVTSSTYIDAEGEEAIIEKTKSVEAYISYMNNIIIDRHSFIKEDIISIINSINSNTSFRIIKSTLEWMFEQYPHTEHKLISDFYTKVIVHSMYMIQYQMEAKNKRDYSYILTNLKNLYLSTRSVDKDLEDIRDLGMKIVKKANGKMSNSLLMSTRTSLILYITLRALISKNK